MNRYWPWALVVAVADQGVARSAFNSRTVTPGMPGSLVSCVPLLFRSLNTMLPIAELAEHAEVERLVGVGVRVPVGHRL